MLKNILLKRLKMKEEKRIYNIKEIEKIERETERIKEFIKEQYKKHKRKKLGKDFIIKAIREEIFDEFKIKIHNKFIEGQIFRIKKNRRKTK